MNRFIDYFGNDPRAKRVEIQNGYFELCPIKREGEQFSSYRKLCYFEKGSKKEQVLCDNVRFITPFGDNGIACSMHLPQGDRKIKLYFCREERIEAETGYIADPNHLYYLSHGSLRCCTAIFGDHLILSREEMIDRGYRGEIFFEDHLFWIPSGKKELIDRNYFNYNGAYDAVTKRQKIASEIMLRVDMYIAKGFVHPPMDPQKRRMLSDLTWEAKTAGISDVKKLLDIEEELFNLQPKRAEQIRMVIERFNDRPYLFLRYMEFFYTAMAQISREKEWLESQMLGNEMRREKLDDWYGKICRRMEERMVGITNALSLREDFESSLLQSYERFEEMIREMIAEG